mmetsp:Transcript_7511/g.8704  ORF Transcript_7511/g.8704 Transcript_7511/m.8704 type:complete len:86 (+) Transcript_7511:516-773(+)
MTRQSDQHEKVAADAVAYMPLDVKAYRNSLSYTAFPVARIRVDAPVEASFQDLSEVQGLQQSFLLDHSKAMCFDEALGFGLHKLI